MTEQYEVEMLRQYFYEQDLELSTIKKLLDTDVMPFDGYYSKWENETKFENDLFSQYVRKNQLISLEQRITELTNHIDNSVLAQFSKEPSNYIFASSYNNGIIMESLKRYYSDILVAKGIYDNLDKLVNYYVSGNKNILLGICKIEDDYYERAIDYYKNLKSNLEENFKNKQFTEIEDKIEFGKVKKKIYLLKSE